MQESSTDLLHDDKNLSIHSESGKSAACPWGRRSREVAPRRPACQMATPQNPNGAYCRISL